MSRLVKWLGFFVFVVFLGIVLLNKIVGFNYYVRALTKIYSLPGEEKMKALNLFWGNDKTIIYGGTLARIETGRKSGVWLWGKSGLRFLEVGEHTMYSVFSACSKNNLNLFENNLPTASINKVTHNSYNEWKTEIKPGDYIAVVSVSNKSNTKITTELRGYDYWFFVKGGLSLQCKK